MNTIIQKIFKRYKDKEQNLGKIKSYDYSLLKYKKLNNKLKKNISCFRK